MQEEMPISPARRLNDNKGASFASWGRRSSLAPGRCTGRRLGPVAFHLDDGCELHRQEGAM